MSKFDVDEELVRKLAKLLKETDLAEIEFESEGKRIRVNAQSALGRIAGASTAAPVTPAAPAPSVAPRPEGPVPGTVTSPMVGTAYLSPEPGSSPFVKIGDRVNKGQTILIIEAMKVMNPIPAPDSGVVQSIMASDGQPVEFGEPLMVIQ